MLKKLQNYLTLLFKFLYKFKTPLYYTHILFILAVLDKIFRGGFTIPVMLMQMFFIYILSYLLYFISPRLMKITSSILIIIGILTIYFLGYLQYPVQPFLVWLIVIQASSQEFFSYLNFGSIVLLLLTLVLLILLWRTKNPKHKLNVNRKFICLILFILLIPTSFISTTKFANGRRATPVPYVLIPKNSMIERMINTYSLNQPSFINNLQYQEKPINIVLHIGETARADHLGINGYTRNTTPNLKKLPIINFGAARSCGSITFISWGYLFNRSSCSDELYSLKQKTIPYYFTQKGFYTSIAAQIDEVSLYTVIKETTRQQDIEKFQDNIYEAYNNLKSKSQHSLIILNSYGSHQPYITVPKDYKPFVPICSTRKYEELNNCKIEEVINSYDNTIAFLDETVSKVLKDLEKNKNPSIYIYISDHGEDLRDNGGNYYGHGTQTIEAHMVPFFVYTNKAFQIAYPKQYKALIDNAKKYKDQMAQDVIWHSIMDIGGFSNKPGENTIDYTRSIFNPQLLPRVKAEWYKVDYKRN